MGWDRMSVLVGLVVAGACAVGVRGWVAEPKTIGSFSMEPTLRIDDRLVVDKLTYRLREPRIGEIVLFSAPDAVRSATRPPMVKRVVAVAGQRVRVADGLVWVDGVAQVEAYVAEPPGYAWGPSEVPRDSLFVLGDNRNASADSHVWGFLPRDAVTGRVALRVWPAPDLF